MLKSAPSHVASIPKPGADVHAILFMAVKSNRSLNRSGNFNIDATIFADESREKAFVAILAHRIVVVSNLNLSIISQCTLTHTNNTTMYENKLLQFYFLMLWYHYHIRQDLDRVTPSSQKLHRQKKRIDEGSRRHLRVFFLLVPTKTSSRC